jgi:uncharacterized spore protein YtfJ
MALNDVIKTALEQIKYIAQTETVIGEPIKAGDITLIPVSKVSIGFAAGSAAEKEKESAGAGTGGGINITPIAFISISDNHVQVHPLTPSDPIMGKILSYAPDIFKKLSKFMSKKDEMSSKES